jgi:hypothetical protein
MERRKNINDMTNREKNVLSERDGEIINKRINHSKSR